MKTMHAVLFFAFVGMSFAGKLTEDDLSADDKQCLKDIGFEIQALVDSVDDDYVITEGNAKINEFSECSFRKLNVIDENDDIKYDEVKAVYSFYVPYVNNNVVDKDQASSAAVESCKSVTGDNLGDRTIKFHNCCVRYVKAH